MLFDISQEVRMSLFSQSAAFNFTIYQLEKTTITNIR